MRWRRVPGFTGVKASACGQIMRYGNILPQGVRVRKYRGVWVGRPMMVHRLVLFAFCGKPKSKKEAMHLDGNPMNNRISNLRWGSHAENMAMDCGNNHAHRNESNPNAKLDRKSVEDIRNAYLRRKGFRWGRRMLAAKYDISENQIRNIATRKQGGWT